MNDVQVHGPIFDGRADRAAHELADALGREIAQQGLADVHHFLDSSIRHPTPYYEVQINVAQRGRDYVVNDRGIIYGPWLEGVGSRNSPVTRFPGYFSFRRATEQLRAQVPGIVAPVVARYVREMQ